MNMKSSEDADEQSLRRIPTYRAGVAQSSAYRLLKKFTEQSLKNHDITMMQWFIIGTVYDAQDNGVTITELSKIVDTNVPYITNTVNALVLKGIVRREQKEGDSRSRVVTIDSTFIPTLKAIEQDLRHKMRTVLYANIAPEELRVYVKVLFTLNSLLADNTEN